MSAKEAAVGLASLALSAIVGQSGREAAFGAVTATAGTLAAWLGGWDTSLKLLLVLMAADYAAGVLGAIKEKRVSSDVMFWGGIRKIAVLFVVGLAVLLDQWMQLDTPLLRTISLFYYAGREGLSLVENLGALGVPLPPQMKNVFVQLQNRSGTAAPQALPKQGEKTGIKQEEVEAESEGEGDKPS
jgi:toxin secretion/phage lysis holin